MYENNFGEELARARKSKNYTQQQLADYIGVSRQSISSWEMERTQPDPVIMEKLQNILELKEKDQSDRNAAAKLYHLVFLAVQAILVITFAVYSFRITQEFNTLLIMIILCICSAVVCLMFENAIKHKDYAIIAGFDKQRKYSFHVLNNILLAIEKIFLFQGIISTLFLYAINIFLDKKLGMVFTSIAIIEYFIAVIVGTMRINYQYKDGIYIDDHLENSISNTATIVYLLQIVGIIIVTADIFHMFGIENNTAPALVIAGLVILYSIIITIGLIIKRKTGINYKGKRIRFVSILYILSIVFCIIIIGLIFLVGFMQ